MFESRRRANEARKTALQAAAILTLSAVLLLFISITTRTQFLLYIALVFFIMAIGAFVSRGAQTWSIGASGEETTAQHLSLLSNSYRVIHDVVLPGMRGNIDHIVLGPNGIFVIETKNHRGFISCQGDAWTQRKIGQLGTPYLGNIGCPSKQVKRSAVLLKHLISDRLGINLYVSGIVVFTNKDAVLRVSNPTVAVLKPSELSRFIQTHNSETTLRGEQLTKIEETIRPYSQFH
jgi:hypothetical protein